MTAVAPVRPVTIRLDGLSVYAHHWMVVEERTLGLAGTTPESPAEAGLGAD